MHEIPFSNIDDPIRSSEGPGHVYRDLREFTDRKDKLVREFNYGERFEKFVGVDRFATKEGFEFLGKIRDEFKFLQERYNISVVNFDFVIGEPSQDHAPGQESLYTVVDRVEGGALMESGAEMISEHIAELEDAFIAILDYYSERIQQHSFALGDFGIRQFMIGRRTGDEADRLYLVDLDPYSINFAEKRTTQMFLKNFAHIMNDDLSSLEEKIAGSGLKMDRARARLEAFKDFVSQFVEGDTNE